MEDFNALAAAVATGIGDVRCCLILSRDGLVLGAHPEAAEPEARSAWGRLANLGEPERGFLELRTELWCYLRRGPYAAFVIADVSVRPGRLLDHLETVLLGAEEARALREPIRPEAAPPAPGVGSSRPRTPLHPYPRPADPTVVIHERRAPVGRAGPEVANTALGQAGMTAPESGPRTPAPAPTSGPADPPEPSSGTEPQDDPDPPEPDDDVDRYSLTREFSWLLQDDEDDADG